MKSILTLIVSLLTLHICSGQSKWQVGIDAYFLYAHYSSHDPGAKLKPNFSIPTGAGSLVISHAVNRGGLFIESGVGYRQMDVAYAVYNNPFNSFSSTNGVGIWFIPLLFRQDLQFAFLKNRRRFQLSLKGGLLNNFVFDEGIGKSSFSSSGNGLNLTGKSDVSHHYSVTGCIGAEIRFQLIKQRMDGLVQMNRLFGVYEVLRTNINYTYNGSSQQAYISNSGSGYTPIGIGLRYHFQ